MSLSLGGQDNIELRAILEGGQPFLDRVAQYERAKAASEAAASAAFLAREAEVKIHRENETVLANIDAERADLETLRASIAVERTAVDAKLKLIAEAMQLNNPA